MTDQTDELDQDDAAVAAAAAQRKAIADALRVELHYAQHKGFERPDVDVDGIRQALADLGEPLEDTADHTPRETAAAPTTRRGGRGRRTNS